jgi:ribosomal protein S18 acetylase RimI-like enzyme
MSSHVATVPARTLTTSTSTRWSRRAGSSSSPVTTPTWWAASAWRSILEPERHTGEVKRLWVRPDLRRRGVGAALMEAVVVAARDIGLRELYLETGFLQPEAIAFYAAIGWRSVDSLPEGAFSYPSAHRFHLRT